MKLEIDIDEKEFGVDIENKFQDFFKRLQAEIQNRLISNDTLVCGVYELETIEMFLTAFKNATIEKKLILDKIRAEIEQLRLHKAQFITSDNKVCIDSQEVLNIIDKYKAESEDKEYILNKI